MKIYIVVTDVVNDVTFFRKSVNKGINHGFQCSNIRWITRKVFEHKAAGMFEH